MFISQLHKQYVGSVSHLNLVIWPKLPQVSCSSVVERLTGVRKVIGLTRVQGGGVVGRTRKFFLRAACVTD